jgi:AcrR family transcriptional regulator
MKKQVEITDATRKAFIDAFFTLYTKRAIEKITINELARKAGYNRCTFYQYFKDIYELLTYIEDIVISQVKENFMINIEHRHFNETFISAFTKLHEEKAEYVDLLFGNSNSLRFTERLKTEIAPILIEKFDLPKDNVKSIYIAELYFSTVISAVIRWVNNQRDLSLTELSTLIRDVLTLGILPQINKYSSKS